MVCRPSTVFNFTCECKITHDVQYIPDHQDILIMGVPAINHNLQCWIFVHLNINYVTVFLPNDFGGRRIYCVAFYLSQGSGMTITSQVGVITHCHIYRRWTCIEQSGVNCTCRIVLLMSIPTLPLYTPMLVSSVLPNESGSLHVNTPTY